MESILNMFEEIGFSKNEAKAYVSLLKEAPLNGYEISKKSGVPRSMVYAVITKLLGQGAITELRTEPPTYIPVPAKELLGEKKRKTEETLNQLERELNAIEKPSDVYVIKHIEESEKIVESMKKMMMAAEEEIWLSAWEEQLDFLQNTAQNQINNGISIYSMLFTNKKSESFGTAFYHNDDTALIEKLRMQQRLTIVIRDNKEVLIAGFIEGQTSLAIQTADPMLILLAKEYIRHDMMMKVVRDRIGEEQLDSLWRGVEILKYIVKGKKD